MQDKVMFTALMPKELVHQARIEAAKLNQSRSEFVRRAIEAALQQAKAGQKVEAHR